MRRFVIGCFAIGLVVALSPAVTQAQPTQLDHLKCYKIKDTAKFKASVTLEALQSQFGMEDCSLLGKGKFFCVMVDKTVTSFEDKTKVALDPASFPAQRLDEDRICYKLKCPKTDIAALAVTDQFGTREVSKFKPAMLCTPAVKGVIDHPVPCLASGPACAGPCPNSTDICQFVSGTTDCECLPEQTLCQESSPQCNGECPVATDVCRPAADGDICVCTEPPTPCQEGSPLRQCNGDCPDGTACFVNAIGECDCFDADKCENTVAPQCGGTCPVGSICTEDPASGRCECL